MGPPRPPDVRSGGPVKGRRGSPLSALANEAVAYADALHDPAKLEATR
jgi:hypothetical protein